MTEVKSANACKGKQSFISKAEARQWLRDSPPRGNLRPYKCPECGYVHVGHKISKQEVKRRRTNA